MVNTENSLDISDISSQKFQFSSSKRLYASARRRITHDSQHANDVGVSRVSRENSPSSYVAARNTRAVRFCLMRDNSRSRTCRTASATTLDVPDIDA